MKRSLWGWLVYLLGPAENARIRDFEAEPEPVPRPNAFAEAMRNPRDNFSQRRQFARYLHWVTSHEVGSARECHRYTSPNGYYIEEYESPHAAPRIVK